MSLCFKDLPAKHVMVMRVLQAYENASSEDKFHGMVWYDDALLACEDLTADIPYGVEQIAGVMATVSPGMVWDENETAPKRIIDLHWNGIPTGEWTGFSTYPHNLEKAERILDEDLSAIKGDKVTNFYRAIMGDTQAVTVDRWMVRIVMDDPRYGTAGGGTKDKATMSSSKTYYAIAEAITESARLIGINPRELQAITWTYYRRMHLGKNRPRKDNYGYGQAVA